MAGRRGEVVASLRLALVGVEYPWIDIGGELVWPCGGEFVLISDSDISGTTGYYLVKSTGEPDAKPGSPTRISINLILYYLLVIERRRRATNRPGRLCNASVRQRSCRISPAWIAIYISANLVFFLPFHRHLCPLIVSNSVIIPP